ncbi:MAG: LysR family transcriptional regulator [Acidimicrobiales bacterium]|nr:LysR family transcriptional regulator [Acidimicrobiales bacterium]
MDLRQLECFLAVADTLHFGHAAEQLHLAQPTVSESVRRLEREVGGPLFDRTTRNVTLTALGVAFRGEADAAYRRVQDAYTTGRILAQRRPEACFVGHAMDVSENILRLVPEMGRRCPEIVLTLQYMSTMQQLESLRRRRLQLGVCWQPDLSGELVAMPMGEATLLAVVPADHPLADHEEIPLALLATEPLIGWPRELHPGMYDRFANAMDALGEPWALVGTTVGFDNVASRVLAGHGVGVVPGPAVGESRVPTLAYIPVTDGPAFERVAVWRRGETNPAVPVLVDLMSEAFAPC